MGELLIVALLGGLITGLSPCIVPVLPVIVTGGSAGANRSRPYLIIGGLVISFSISELVGSSLLSALHLPQDLLFWLGVGLLALLSVGLMIPIVGEWIERPFARLGSSRYANKGGGFVLGLSLGLVFVPCAGPVLTAISVAAAHHHVGATSLFVTLFYAVGATLPLLIFAIVAQRATTSWAKLRTHLPRIRQISGVVLALTTLAIATNLLSSIQRDVPGYTTALEDHVESTESACTQLQHLSGEHQNQFATANAKLEGKKATCSVTDSASSSNQIAAGSTSSGGGATTTTAPPTTTAPTTPAASNTTTTTPVTPVTIPATTRTFGKSSLPELGDAPNFTGIVAWLNTPGNTSLSLRKQLKGKVVLVDFWTYSCINCQRSLPHVEGWYNDYKKDGFVVVGVSTPEFAFEHVVSNVQSAADSLHIDYPIAVDNNYGTWDAYNNQYWPAEYLIDPDGHVRAYDFGEGGYSTMENNIRNLLSADEVTKLPARTDVANKTPTSGSITPESYVGYGELNNEVGTTVVDDKAITYRAPATIPSNSLAFNGIWTDHKEEATAGTNATLDLEFTADDVYLVMGGTGTVDVSYNGRHLKTLTIKGIPTLYTLLSGPALQSGQLTLSMSPGVEAYDFTFG
jgi:cytochrome c biogenesis protein CcdA/thiol-disulfide isomerase/thioredoxin